MMQGLRFSKPSKLLQPKALAAASGGSHYDCQTAYTFVLHQTQDVTAERLKVACLRQWSL